MNETFLKKADALRPTLCRHKVTPQGEYGQLDKGESRTFDMGNHYVGRLSVRFSLKSGTFDAPFFVKFFFAENETELQTDVAAYDGALSGAWIQEEYAHVDELPFTLCLPRRYACRYIRIELLSTSPAYTLGIDEMIFTEETSARGEVETVGTTPLERRIDEVSLRTLRSCMQDVFEDGPKRDRRLWLGDLRLQALTNYVTYKNNDLVKRCLYLFAGATAEDGFCKGCVFTKPNVYVDGGKMFDYPLLFVPTLLEYYEATGDFETAEELLPTALAQIRIAKEYFDENGLIVQDGTTGWTHIDWSDTLDKLACGQGVYITAVKAAKKLAVLLGSETEWLDREIEEKSAAALRVFYDAESGVFKGKDGQISYMQNVWLCLAELFPKSENAKILRRLEECETALRPASPYGYHYYVQALCDCGEMKKAKEIVLWYWGEMVQRGADTFYEVFDPDNADESPYGCAAVNSYCHAWSCTPTYFFRKYGL